MLPAIVNANLARGAFLMAKKKAIVKRLDAIQNLGGMSVLCSDKTGTLTKDKITLCHYVSASGHENAYVLQLAYSNAVNQSGKKNSIDAAIIESGDSLLLKKESTGPGQKIAEIPFNFDTRRSSVIFRNESGMLLLVCKGAFEEVLSLCTHMRSYGEVCKLDGSLRQDLHRRASAHNEDGYRVILVATRELGPADLNADIVEGLDTGMAVEGLLTFLDPPKEDAASSVARLQELGVDVKVLTGDNLGVAMNVCRQLNLVSQVEEGDIQAITGTALASIDDKDELKRVVKSCKIFAKVTPSQKGQVVMQLKQAGDVVGMLGDGINDCVALRYADAGISVDSGANAAKDCADSMSFASN